MTPKTILGFVAKAASGGATVKVQDNNQPPITTAFEGSWGGRGIYLGYMYKYTSALTSK